MGPVQPVEVLADRAPVEVDVVAGAVPAGDGGPHLAEGAVVDGRVRQAVLAEDFEGHALRGLRAVVRVAEQGEVAVGVHVNEARGEDEPVRVEGPAPAARESAAREPADLGDPALVDADVGGVRGPARAVDDAGPPDDQVHRPVPRRRCGRSR